MKRIFVKRTAWICTIVVWILVFVSCNVTTENKIEQEAVNAYIKYTIDHTDEEDSSFLYVSDGKIVTVVNGKATGVYTERATAMAALFNDPETDVDESVYYVANATALDGLFVCGQSSVFSAVHQEASNAYKQYIVVHASQMESKFIYTGEGLFVPMENGIVGYAKFTLESAMTTLFGDSASSYKLTETEVDGLFICMTAEKAE